MYARSLRFWRPFLISILINFVTIILTLAYSGGNYTGGQNYPEFFGFVFPFAALSARYLGNGLIPFMFQIPVYGLVLGMANLTQRVETVVLRLICIHLFAFALTALV